MGHGETMCSRCFVTNREAAALGITNECDVIPGGPTNDNKPKDSDEANEDQEPPLICPVSSQPCVTEQDEFCEDYGCARKAGIDVDRDLIG